MFLTVLLFTVSATCIMIYQTHRSSVLLSVTGDTESWYKSNQTYELLEVLVTFYDSLVQHPGVLCWFLIITIHSHFFTHSLFSSFILLNYMFQPYVAIVRFECKFEAIELELYHLFFLPMSSQIIIKLGVKYCF
jgi:hypothetical protein